MLSIVVLATMIGGSWETGLLLDNSLPDGILPIDTVGTTDTNQKPWFCHDLECPKFKVLETNERYEVRRYEPSVWVTTRIQTANYSRSENREVFYRLFHYISGNNTRHVKMAMTTPVVTVIEHGSTPEFKGNVTKHFMIPFEFHDDTPLPTEPNVFIQRYPATVFFVKQYSSFSNENARRLRMRNELAMDLQTDKRQYSDALFVTAGYDGPYTFTERHNEIWLMADIE